MKQNSLTDKCKICPIGEELKRIINIDKSYEKHINKKQDYYWGKSKRLFKFYEAQSILMEDLKLRYKNGDVKK